MVTIKKVSGFTVPIEQAFVAPLDELIVYGGSLEIRTHMDARVMGDDEINIANLDECLEFWLNNGDRFGAEKVNE